MQYASHFNHVLPPKLAGKSYVHHARRLADSQTDYTLQIALFLTCIGRPDGVPVDKILPRESCAQAEDQEQTMLL